MARPLGTLRTSELLCPSAQPDMKDARIFGVLSGTPEAPHVAYLTQGVQIDAEAAQDLGDLDPAQVFRFAARCEQGRCCHFDAGRCSLAARIVSHLPIVVDALPVCQVRAGCRWFAEQGVAACRRCPQVITMIPRGEDPLSRAAMPDVRAAPP